MRGSRERERERVTASKGGVWTARTDGVLNGRVLKGNSTNMYTELACLRPVFKVFQLRRMRLLTSERKRTLWAVVACG